MLVPARCVVFRFLIAWTLFAFAASAQVAASPPARELVLQNLAPNARREGAAVVVPFAPGAVAERPALHVANTRTEWQPFGARWPDGSLRQALCLFEAEVAALGELRVALVDGAGPELPTGPIPLPAVELTVVARVAGVLERVQPAFVVDLEHNALRRVALLRGRVGASGFVAEVQLTVWRDQAHAHCDVAVFWSDPRTPAMQCKVDELRIESVGMFLLLRHTGRFGITQQRFATGTHCTLARGNTFGDGQGVRRCGVLLPAVAANPLFDNTQRAAATAPLLGATSWRDSGAFGPFGYVPELPPWLQGRAVRAHLAQRHRAFVDSDRPPGDPFALMPHGLQRMAGQTGDQEDFGVCKLSLVANTGLPSFLLEVEASVLQEACRPVHFYEADGTPVEPAKHPDWVVWSGRTHWHGGVSTDRLGKPVPEPAFDSHGYTGKDREHWSSNYLGAYALLTGAHWARDELANEARLYLAGQTIDPRFTTSHSGAPRGGGRTALAAAWNLLVRGDAALAARMDERMERVYYQEWSGRTLRPDQVRTMSFSGPDPRMLQGGGPYWNPWQDALAAVGFAAHHLVTGNAHARELAEALAANVVRHGWLVTPQRMQIATALRWQDGAPLSAEQWQRSDPKDIQLADGTGFAEWALGAVEIARVVAERDGDQELAARCAAIQQRARTGRAQPRDGGIDRGTEWDAVRWPPR